MVHNSLAEGQAANAQSKAKLNYQIAKNETEMLKVKECQGFEIF